MKNHASIQLENGGLVFSSSYDAGLVAAFKGAIPSVERKWDPARKVWLVASQHGQLLANLCSQYLGVQIDAPSEQIEAKKEVRIFDLRYVGATKQRPGDEECTAYGFCNGSWSIIFPESVLLKWFTGMPNQTEGITLYGLLGVKRGASQEEIKTSFRRMARQWHPDISKEPDAAEMFIRIKEAYEALSDPGLRSRYDAGLALEATLERHYGQIAPSYRPPLRCGLVMAEGKEQLGRFVVSEILGWEDIHDDQGRILVVSWPVGAVMFEEKWLLV